MLYAAPDVICGLGAELDDMKRVEDRGGVFELVIDRVLVPVERIQRRLFDPMTEPVAAAGEPVPIRLPRASRDQIQQPCTHLAISGWSQVDHASQRFRPTPTRADRALRDVMPDVLIDPEPHNAIEAGLVIGHGFEQRSDRRPHCVPRRAQLAGDAGDRSVLVADLANRPPTRPHRQQRTRQRDRVVAFGERPRLASVVDAAPRPLAPHQPHRPTEARHVNQRHVAAAVAVRDHPTHHARHRGGRRFDGHLEHVTFGVVTHREHMHTGQADEHITPRAIRGTIIRTRAAARRRLGHRRGPSSRFA